MIIIGYVVNGTDVRTVKVNTVDDAVKCINTVRVSDTLTFAGVAAPCDALVAIALMTAR